MKAFISYFLQAAQESQFLLYKRLLKSLICVGLQKMLQESTFHHSMTYQCLLMRVR